MSLAKAATVHILLVEDSPGEVVLTRQALQGGKIHNEIHVVSDGVEAMEFLNRTGRHTNAVRPDLILLDLNLPKMDGREVLSEIKDSDELRQIPVVVLTTSQDESDILASYNLNANCYITKPVDFHQFIDVIKAVKHFYFTIIQLPAVE